MVLQPEWVTLFPKVLVVETPFDQLIAGAVWLPMDDQMYPEPSFDMSYLRTFPCV